MYYCAYYQACVVRATTWFFTSVLRSYEHLAFDRTLEKSDGIFEFFVPQGMETHFIEFMADMQAIGMVSDVKKLENRLMKGLDFKPVLDKKSN